MPNSLLIGNFAAGLQTDREPFAIDNGAFPVLNNAYVWRGRVLRKRGTNILGRLQRSLTSVSLGNFSSATTVYNLFTLLGLNVISPNAQLVNGFVITIGAPDSQTLTDVGTGTLTISPVDATKITSATVNYQTGVLTLVWGGAVAASAATFTGDYYPNLPVMGLESFDTNIVNFPKLVAFDTIYSYQFNDATSVFYSTSFYKISGAPVTWSGTDYQQFWSTNYSGAMWVTNARSGWNFGTITGITAASPAVVTIVGHGLTTGDYVFINEIGWNNATTQAKLNGHSFQVTVLTANTFSIIVDTTTGGAYTSGGIAQYITRSVPQGGAVTNTGDGIRWYDGDPVNTSLAAGWVNFAPPVTNNGLTAASLPTYLIGAKMIIPFKGRLLFFGVTLATSAAPSGTYFPNRLISSQDGTPYYTDPVPTYENQTSDGAAYFTNVVGRGFRLNAPLQQEIVTIQENEDVLLCGYETKQLKLLFTFDDTLPFIYQTINSELGSQSTYSGVNLDDGAITIGEYGLSITNQSSASRIDLKIPDQVYDILQSNNGAQRVTAIRDYRNEFIYFTYPPVDRDSIYPTKTLLYNYRDNTWSTLDENFTHYGQYRPASSYTWATLPFDTWSTWTNPWNFGGNSAEYPNTVGGNQQGFVLIKDRGTTEAYSEYIQNISGNTIISPSHCLQDGDFIQVNAIQGTLSSINQQIFQVVVDDANPNHLNEFTVIPTLPSGTYLGRGVFRRILRPFIQSKQFPVLWDNGRKCRIGTQRFLFDSTFGGQVTVNIYTSQNASDPVNPITTTGYPVFTNILNTFPDTPPQNFYSNTGAQIWQRVSNSFIGDSVQIAITLSDDQMRNGLANSSEIALYAIAFDLYPGPVLV